MAAELVYSDIKLSIGILVSNRIRTIRNCMESLVPLLRQIPSELIALDTVGEQTDGSVDVVREYTDNVYRYEWCRDFANARNTCLNHAKGEWFLFLDDDEWFDNVEELIAFFDSSERENYNFGMFHVRNYIASGGYNTTLATRLIRRRENTHFVGRIHETFHEVFPGGKQFECFLHHNGYVFKTEEERRIHQERNLSLIKDDLAENGISPKRCAQMVQELLARKETAREGYERCVEFLPKLKEMGVENDSCVQWMLVARVRYFYTTHEYEKLLNEVEQIMAFCPLSKAAELALYGVWVQAAVEAGDIRKLPELAEHYLECFDWLSFHAEQRMAQTQLDFPKYQENDYMAQVVQAGALASNGLRDYEKAFKFWKRFPWRTQEKHGQKYQQALLETLRGMTDKQPLVEYYSCFYKKECFLLEHRNCLPEECRIALQGME